MNPSPRPTGIFEQPGSFTIGCNWWASHAGTGMWRDWRPEVVEGDFARMATVGVETVRFFPLWSDFQPLTQLRGYGGGAREIRCAEEPLRDRSGVDPVMLDRLAWTCATAHRHGIGCVLGLVTGWMSGRFFAPEAIAHLDPITDPVSRLWQIRLVRAIVTRLRHEPGVRAWDLGNECNCMGSAPSTAAATTWTAAIADSIRAIDPSRPVVSGMHSLMPEPTHSGNWTIQDQAEHCDVLTTHPYPMWCRHTAQDRVDDPRTTHHATAESRMYADLGGRPCCAEEIGTMGPQMGDDAVVRAFTRVNLFSLWANDCRGFLWWCAFDQSHLAAAPYDWTAVERELGMFRADGSPRPLLDGFQAIRELRSRLPGGILPPPRREVVCILSQGQDQWSVAWSAWILAKQVGFDLRFAWAGQPIPSAERYLLPSVRGDTPISRRLWLDLLARVDAGADLLITLDGGILSPCNDIIGADVTLRRDRRGEDAVRLEDGTHLPLNGGLELILTPRAGTTVLAQSRNGVCAVRRSYGRGRVDFWTIPVEDQFTRTRGSCDADAPPWQQIYALWCDGQAAGRIVSRTGAPWLALTEHVISPAERLVVAINHERSDTAAVITLAPGWRCNEALRGQLPTDGRLAVPAHDAVVWRIVR